MSFTSFGNIDVANDFTVTAATFFANGGIIDVAKDFNATAGTEFYKRREP